MEYFMQGDEINSQVRIFDTIDKAKAWIKGDIAYRENYRENYYKEQEFKKNNPPFVYTPE